MDFIVVAIGCCIWFPLMVWITSLVHWMITDDIDIPTGLVGIFVAVGLGYVAMKPPVPALSPLTFAAVVATIVMYPFVRAGLEKRELRSIDVDALDRAYQALSLKPNNPVAKFKIARLVYAVGMPGHALAIAESALAYLSEQHFPDEHRTLKYWKATVKQPDLFRPIQCVECHTPNAPGNIHCAACGAPFLLDRAKGRVLGKGQGKKLVAAWIAMVAMLAGIPAASTLPPVLTVAAIVALLVAAGAIVFLAFRGDGATA